MPGRLTLDERRLRQRIAANMQRLRDAAGLSVDEAADRAGLHERHWEKIEGGEINVTVRTLMRVADALGVSESRLLD